MAGHYTVSAPMLNDPFIWGVVYPAAGIILAFLWWYFDMEFPKF